jgi:3-hydroxyisobutyrate dehydrogenase-like beta-hydroxyacid dehydrogenase
LDLIAEIEWTGSRRAFADEGTYLRHDVSTSLVVGLLYPGDMGSALGRLLRAGGVRVVTTLAGRSARTQAGAQQAGLEVLDSLREVAQCADILLSLVTPAAAESLAAEFAAVQQPEGRRRIYVDLNSIAPQTAIRIGQRLEGAGIVFVDGAIHGLASRLRERGKVYLSGPAADEVKRLLAPLLWVKVLGTEVGTASTLRMLISGLTKGVIALFLEVGLTARRAGLLEELLANYRDTYPGVMDIVERILPTYPRHARRRAEEVGELEETMAHYGQRPCLAAATHQLIAELGKLGLDEGFPDRTPTDWTVAEVLATTDDRKLLRAN